MVATTNRGKIAEYRMLLAGLPIQLLTLAEVLARPLPVDEDAPDFAGNARKKALAIAHATFHLTLADDSGLEVDALSGGPGVHSARFAGLHATDAENNARLLQELASHAGDRFPARFRCVIALVEPLDGFACDLTSGACEGAIRREARGASGFGYDPLFVVEGHDATLGELGAELKNRVSHRALATAALRPILEARLRAREAWLARIER